MSKKSGPRRITQAVVCGLLLSSCLAYGQNGRPLWAGDVAVSTAPGTNGAYIWTPPNVAIVPDSTGGAIVIWTNAAENGAVGGLQAQRLNASGKPLWTANGIAGAPSPYLQSNPRAINDGSGGVIVAWTEPYWTLGPKVFAQRIDANGNPLWATGGVPVSGAVSKQGSTGIGIAPDGSGGALLVWQDVGNVGTQFAVQRLDANGNALWGANGTQITSFPIFSPPGTTDEPLVVEDGSGGALVSYPGSGNTLPQMFQHIDPSGSLLLPVSGVTIGGIVSYDSRMTSDGSGGAIIVGDCAQSVGLCVQRLDANGHPQWGSHGVMVMNNIGQSPELDADGAGGVFVTWEDWRDEDTTKSTYTDEVYVQHIDSSGEATWKVNGVFVSVVNQTSVPDFEVALPRAVADGSGGVIVVWNDCWHYDTGNACMADRDLYARRFDGNGNALWTTTETSETPAGSRITGVVVSNAAGSQGIGPISPSRPMYGLISDADRGAILVWPDGRNRTCDIVSGCDIYAQRISDQYPLDFTLSVVSASQTVAAGQSAQYSVTLATINGPLTAPVNFSCSGASAGAACTISPGSVPSGSASASATLTVSTTAPSSCSTSLRRTSPRYWYGAWVLAFAGVVPLRRRRLRQLLSTLLLVLVCAGLCGCGGGSSPSGSSGPTCAPTTGTPSGTYTLKITGAEGTLTHSVTVTLTVQ